MVSEWELFFRLALSCVLGGIIGYERQSRRKSAGLRTNVLVCLGSCLIMVLSEALYFNVEGRTNADPARLAAQVVSGIGFLGAGAIMKEGLNVTGLSSGRRTCRRSRLLHGRTFYNRLDFRDSRHSFTH